MSHDTTQRTSRRRLGADTRLLLRAIRHAGPWVVALALAALAIAGAEIALPFLFAEAIDAIVAGRGAGTWLAWCGALVVVLVAADALDDVATGGATASATAWLRRTLIDHVLAAGTQHARVRNAGELTARLVGNAAEAGRVAPELVRLVAAALLGVGGAVALAVIDPWLCVTFLSGLPLLLALVRAFARDASALAERYLTVQGTIAGRLVEAVAGARTIAAAGTTEREVARVLAPLPELRRHGLGMWRAQMRITAQDGLIVALLEVAVIAVGGLRLAHGHISPGELIAAASYVGIAASLGSIHASIARLARARAGAKRLLDVLDGPVMAYGERSLPAGGPGRLELRGVTVRIGGEPALDRLDLDVAGGTLVAIVGRSGAGKSLLAALAGRLADPDEGEVLLDGVPLRELDRDELRRAVGYGFEAPELLGGTVAEAIAFGAAAPASPGRIVRAARAARADEFVRRLPQGYVTPLARAPLSGGERQRLGLARTFARPARVIVLDDVAASLDTVTEHHIGRVLTGALADRTRLIVAHRASTAARADVVAWLDGGRVRAVGPHRRLWRDEAYRAQFAVEEAAA